jgi:lipopolysaccharide transport system ATP-binding protein
MKVRLGFAVAAQMQPDILIIDEVLAVGDLGFVLKCFKKIDEILPSTAFIFVSHSMPMVSRICNQIMVLEKGHCIFQGTNISKGIDVYYNRFLSNESSVVFTDDSVDFIRAEINGVSCDCGNPVSIPWAGKIALKLFFKNKGIIKSPHVAVEVFDKEQRAVGIFNYQMPETDQRLSAGEFSVLLTNDSLQLSKGLYSFSVALNSEFRSNPLFKMNNIATVKLEHDVTFWHPYLMKVNQKIEEYD